MNKSGTYKHTMLINGSVTLILQSEVAVGKATALSGTMQFSLNKKTSTDAPEHHGIFFSDMALALINTVA